MEFEYFFGAIYLFFINAVFISFSSYLIVRYLKIPFKEYRDSKKLLRTKIVIATFVILVAVPSFFIFFSVIKDVRLNKNLNKFVSEEIQSDNIKVIEWKYIPKKNDVNLLNVYVVGTKLTNAKRDSLNILLVNFGIENTKINISQLSDEKGMEYLKSELKTGFLEEFKINQKTELENQKDSLLRKLKVDSVQLVLISNDIKLFYPEIENIGFSQNYYTALLYNDSNEIKNIPIFTIQWNKNLSNDKMKSKQQVLYAYLKSKTSSDTVQVINFK